MSRDYYEVLGVTRDADTLQIKKAYRKLARELHPDVNSHDPDCEEKFKEATQAYETLCDQERRQIYDTYGEAGLRRGAGGGPGGGPGGGFEGFGGFGDIFEAFFGGDAFGGRGGRSSGPSRGEDMAIEVDLDLEEAAFGVKKDVTLDLVDTCRDCGGAGTNDPDSVKTCSECGGSGRVRRGPAHPLRPVRADRRVQRLRRRRPGDPEALSRVLGLGPRLPGEDALSGRAGGYQ